MRRECVRSRRPPRHSKPSPGRDAGRQWKVLPRTNAAEKHPEPDLHPSASTVMTWYQVTLSAIGDAGLTTDRDLRDCTAVPSPLRARSVGAAHSQTGSRCGAPNDRLAGHGWIRGGTQVPTVNAAGRLERASTTARPSRPDFAPLGGGERPAGALGHRPTRPTSAIRNGQGNPQDARVWDEGLVAAGGVNFGNFTALTSPTSFSSRIVRKVASNSHHRSPCLAELGTA